MRKIFGLIICGFILLENVTFALTNDVFSIDLPSDFTMIEQSEYSGEYSNGQMTISYIITEENEVGKWYNDPKEIKDESMESFGYIGLSFLGFGRDSEVVRIGNRNFLKDVSEIKGSELEAFIELLAMYVEKETGEKTSVKDVLGKNTYDDVKIIKYLGTTAKKMTIIKFAGEDLDEYQVDKIMNTIKLNGVSGRVYDIGIEVGVGILLGGGFLGIIFGIVARVERKSKEKKVESDVLQEMLDLDNEIEIKEKMD